MAYIGRTVYVADVWVTVTIMQMCRLSLAVAVMNLPHLTTNYYADLATEQLHDENVRALERRNTTER